MGGGKAAPAKKKKGGFGKKSASPEFESEEAAALLKKAGGDMDMAQALHFQQSIESLQQSDAGMFAELQELSAQQKQRAAAGEALDASAAPAAAREKLVELTWDSVASFLKSDAPKSPKAKGRSSAGGSPALREKLRRIAAACKSSGGGGGAEVGAGGGGAGGEFAVLDVGCGDGAIVPFLEDIGTTRYMGIDLSPRMVERARRLWGQEEEAAAAAAAEEEEEERRMTRTFHQASFLSMGDSEASDALIGGFDAVLFNGSLQFFDDFSLVLGRAARLLLLKGRQRGRIVVAHANGAAFVETEHRGSPLVAVSTMPSVDQLRELLAQLQQRQQEEEEEEEESAAGSVKMTVVAPPELAALDGGAEIDLDEFYLCACECELLS